MPISKVLICHIRGYFVEKKVKGAVISFVQQQF